MRDGLLLCKLINIAVPATIDERVIQLLDEGGNQAFHDDRTEEYYIENHNLCINSAVAIGIDSNKIMSSNDLLIGNSTATIGFISEVIDLYFLSRISMQFHPELNKLLKEDGEIGFLSSRSPEEILLQWINYHLKASNQQPIANLGKDLKDSTNYAVLLHKISSGQESTDNTDLPKTIIEQGGQDLKKRAEILLQHIESSLQLPCKYFIDADDIVSGNVKANMMLISSLLDRFPAINTQSIFGSVSRNRSNSKSSFSLSSSSKNLKQDIDLGGRRMERASSISRLSLSTNMQMQPPKSSNFSLNSSHSNEDEGTREERAFRFWMNSIGILVKNLFEDLKDGLALLRVLDKISPGIVTWKEVNLRPSNPYEKIENCPYAIRLCLDLKFSLVGINGKNLFEGNRKLTLAVVWQAMRYHILSVLKDLNSIRGKEITDNDILLWANAKVAEAGKESKIQNFRDSSLRDAKFLIDLLDAIRPGRVNYQLVMNGNKGRNRSIEFALSFKRLTVLLLVLVDEECMLNAKYAISIARKYDCCIFLLWEDIVEVKSKMIFIFVATLMSLHFKSSYAVAH
jgi:plastin-1